MLEHNDTIYLGSEFSQEYRLDFIVLGPADIALVRPR